jgi:hypothetical protein
MCGPIGTERLKFNRKLCIHSQFSKAFGVSAEGSSFHRKIKKNKKNNI